MQNAQNIVRAMDGGALSRQRVEPIVGARPRSRRPAAFWLDWAPILLLAGSSLAAGIMDIARALAH